MISDAAYKQWRDDPNARRMVLIEAEHSAGVKYIASSPFISGPTDTPPHQVYDELISSAVVIDAAIDKPMSVGGIELSNDGTLDSWLSYAWHGHPLRVFLGDAAWPRDDFHLVIDGVNGGISQTGVAGLEFALYDRMGTLNTPLQPNVLADGSAVPICLGQVFNITPALLNAATLEYQVNDGPVQSIIVRDNGVNITANCTMDLPNGTFRLNVALIGQITCDVVEQHQTLAQMAEFIATRYSQPIHSANLAAFPSAATLGYYTRDNVTGGQVLIDLAASLGAYPRFSLLGQLQLIRLDLSGAPTASLDENDILDGGLLLTEIQQPASSVVVRYKKNWSVQSADALAGSVSDTDRDIYSREYSSVKVTNPVSDYPLAAPREVDTYITDGADALIECARRAAMRAVARESWSLKGFLSSVDLFVGDTQETIHPDFGFGVGRDGCVIAIRKSLLDDNVELEVLI